MFSQQDWIQIIMYTLVIFAAVRYGRYIQKKDQQPSFEFCCPECGLYMGCDNEMVLGMISQTHMEEQHGYIFDE